MTSREARRVGRLVGLSLAALLVFSFGLSVILAAAGVDRAWEPFLYVFGGWIILMAASIAAEIYIRWGDK